jgi:PhnB protein
MNTPQIPAGHHRVTPYFLVSDAEAFIAFLKLVFKAVDREMHRDDLGRVMHAELTIGDSVLMLGQASNEWKASTSMNYLYVADTDATHAACIAAGCTELYAPRDERYSMRSSGVRDPWGNTWWLAQPLG